MFEPEHDVADFDEVEQIGGEFFVWCCDPVPLLDACEEALDTLSLLVDDAIVVLLVRTVPAPRDDGFAALFVEQIMQAAGVIGAVIEHLQAVQSADQVAGGCHVVLLARPQDEADRQIECIEYRKMAGGWQEFAPRRERRTGGGG